MHSLKVLVFGLLVLVLLAIEQVHTQTHAVSGDAILTVRVGQGGYLDDRSDLGKLGGGQVFLSYQPEALHFSLGITSEYYTNSPDPSHSYEIASMIGVNITYFPHYAQRGPFTPFMGLGPAWYEIPLDNTDPQTFDGALGINAEVGTHMRVFKAFNLFAVGKYLLAQQVQVDVNQWALLLGVSVRWPL